MELVIKNIILYDPFGNVGGFAEFKIRGDRTNIRVRYNDGGSDVSLFSIVANGEPLATFEITGVQTLLEFRGRIDAEREIFICISTREGGEVKTLASGVINSGNAKHPASQSEAPLYPEGTTESNSVLDETAVVEPSKSAAVAELDEALRKICIIDEHGRGQCETCPYREHFFGRALGAGEDVVV